MSMKLGEWPKHASKAHIRPRGCEYWRQCIVIAGEHRLLLVSARSWNTSLHMNA